MYKFDVGSEIEDEKTVTSIYCGWRMLEPDLLSTRRVLKLIDPLHCAGVLMQTMQMLFLSLPLFAKCWMHGETVLEAQSLSEDAHFFT